MWRYKSCYSSSKLSNPCPQLEGAVGSLLSLQPLLYQLSLVVGGKSWKPIWKCNFSCKEPNRSTGILHNIFLSWKGCSWVWPGVMGSKSSLNSPVELLDCRSLLQPLSQLGIVCLLSQYSLTSALRKYPKMHSRPSVCTERLLIQFACLGSASTEGLLCGCSRNLRDAVPPSFLTLTEALFHLGQVLLPVKPTKLLQEPVRLLWFLWNVPKAERLFHRYYQRDKSCSCCSSQFLLPLKGEN